MSKDDNGIYYFIANLPSHLPHALPLHKEIGGTFVVLSKSVEEAVKAHNVPVICLDDRPDLYLTFDRRIANTINYLNTHAKTVLFYDIFKFSFLKNIRKPTKIFLTHGNMLKPYMLPRRVKQIKKNFDYMVALSPYLKEKFIMQYGINPKKLIDAGIARTDEVIKNKGKIVGKEAFVKLLDWDEKTPILSYMPTWFTASSVKVTGLQIVQNFPDNFNLVFRPHPQMSKDLLNKYIKIIEEKPNVAYLPDGRFEQVDMLTIFSISSAIIGDASSVMLEAILIDKPLIFAYDPDKEADLSRDLASIREIEQFSCKIKSNNVDKIDETLQYALDKGICDSTWSKVKQQVFFNYQGDCIKTLASYINGNKAQ